MSTLQQKYETLKKEFKQLDINDDAHLDKQEMFTLLDRKIGRQFDREIGEELWTHLDANQDGKVELNEFITILLKAEDSLKCKIQNSRTALELNYQQKRETESKLNNLQEETNKFGLNNNSQLCVIVLEAANLKSDGKPLDPFVQVTVDKYDKQTPISKGNNPKWNDHNQFYFPILTGKEDIIITVFDFDSHTQNIVVARLNLNVYNNKIQIKDQQLHDVWLDLFDIKGNLVGSQIRLQIQWIYSKTKYLREVLTSYQQQITIQEQELLEYERDLHIIYEPFLLWRQLNTQGFPQQNIKSPIQTILTPTQQVRKIQQQPPPALYSDPKFRFNLILMGILGCLTLMISFKKAQYFDLVLLMDFFILYDYYALNENRIKSLGMLSGFSCILDLIWFFIVGYNWLTADDSRLFIKYELSIQSIITILVLISLLLKAYIALNLFQLSQDMTKGDIAIQKQQIIKIDPQANAIESQVYLHNGRPIVIY